MLNAETPRVTIDFGRHVSGSQSSAINVLSSHSFFHGCFSFCTVLTRF